MYIQTSNTKSGSRVSVTASGHSLSDYFPNGTEYFYGYPAGAASGFMNKVVPEVEELVAARAVSCAGPNVTAISFAATSTAALGPGLIQTLGLPTLPQKQMVILPANIDSKLTGDARDIAIKKALLSRTSRRHFVMAQPFTDAYLAGQFQIAPALTSWLNDKRNMPEYIMSHHIPRRMATYDSGDEFASSHASFELPYVIKVSASSAGDGVYICRSAADAEDARQQLKHVEASIFIEQYIVAAKNYGVHFGVPHSANKPIDIIGINEQLTGPDGEFLGGIIESTAIPSELSATVQYIESHLLPHIRRMGWYGVGDLDVLIDDRGGAYIIDCNFRMTGMTAYHFLVRSQQAPVPLIGFSGSFEGSRTEFENAVLPLLGHHSDTKKLQLIAVNHHNGNWNFNAALLLDKQTDRNQQINQILQSGLKSSGLQHMINR
jgi:hypothetical protein